MCAEDKSCVTDIGYRAMKYGEKAPNGQLLRPFIVWFGEDVPKFDDAIEVMKTADIVVIIGTSLKVYPAASLYDYAPNQALIYLIDPNEVTSISKKIEVIKEKAGAGMELLSNKLSLIY